MAEKGKISFGVLGTGWITTEVVKSFQSCAIAQVVAVGSRDIAKSSAWAAKYQPTNGSTVISAYGTYEGVLADPLVQVVYIPLPTILHKEWAIKAAQAGKHVLCEKPVAASANELVEILKACKASNVQFMDGVFWSHQPRFMSVSSHFDKLGKITNVHSNMTWRQEDPSNIRINAAVEVLGSLGDLGWYTVRATLFGFNNDLPSRVIATGDYQTCGEHKSPNSVTAMLLYDDGRTATMRVSFDACQHQTLEIQGTEGVLRVDDFVWAHKQADNDCYSIHGKNGLVEHIRLPSTEFDTRGRSYYMIEDFAKIVISGHVDHYWSELSLKNQLVIDALLQSLASGQMVAIDAAALLLQ